MQKFSTLIISLGLAFCSHAQDIKLLDYAPQYAKLKVKERKTIEIKNNKGQQDTMVYGLAIMNEHGLPIHYTEYFARGRKMAEYTYEYDGAGKLINHSVATTFNDWQKVDFKIAHDAKGRLSSRELPESISNFWIKETFQYNSNGVLIKNQHWYEKDGGLTPLDYKDYPPTLQVDDNSLTYINDQHGLLILHQLYNSQGKIERCWKHEYAFR